jgi:3-oxoacyl-[acyl-carrier-protein] synthase-3
MLLTMTATPPASSSSTPLAASRRTLALPTPPKIGVRIAGTGSQLPSRVVSNADIATIVDTNDEWIYQRTGIHERRVCDQSKGESNRWLCAESLRKALADAKMQANELDLIICGTITQDMRCPSTACLVAGDLKAGTAAAWDLGAACSSFVYALNTAHDLIRMGNYRAIGVIGCDTVSVLVDYTNRGVCILFGDGAGAAVIRATDDQTKGCIAQINHADGTSWPDLYMPGEDWMIPEGADRSTHKSGCLQMNGKAVFKFAVSTFQELIQQTLDKAGLTAGEVDLYVCHQSNMRILEAARDKFGIPEHKLLTNIERVGNTSAGSVPLLLDEIARQGKIKEGMKVMFVAFGAGLTWSSSLWQV